MKLPIIKFCLIITAMWLVLSLFLLVMGVSPITAPIVAFAVIVAKCAIAIAEMDKHDAV